MLGRSIARVPSWVCPPAPHQALRWEGQGRVRPRAGPACFSPWPLSFPKLWEMGLPRAVLGGCLGVTFWLYCAILQGAPGKPAETCSRSLNTWCRETLLVWPREPPAQGSLLDPGLGRGCLSTSMVVSLAQ